MVQVIEGREGFGSRFAQGLGAGLSNSMNSIAEAFGNKKRQELLDQRRQQEAEVIKQLTGQDISGLSPELTKIFFHEALKGQEAEKGRLFEGDQARLKRESDIAEKGEKLRGESMKKIAPLQSGLETLKRMRAIGQKNNLGIGSSLKGYISPETRKDRAEYEQLGKSLISLASNIPIRNQMEFETLSKQLYDPSMSDDAREGVLNAMERIISQSLQEFDMDDQETAKDKPIQSKKERPPLSSFHR